MFVCTDPQCTLLSKEEGMQELKISQIPPKRALRGLNSSLDVLVQPACKSHTFFVVAQNKAIRKCRQALHSSLLGCPGFVSSPDGRGRKLWF